MKTFLNLLCILTGIVLLSGCEQKRFVALNFNKKQLQLKITLNNNVSPFIINGNEITGEGAVYYETVSG